MWILDLQGDLFEALISGKKKEPKPKLLGPDISGWGGGLPREGVGAEKFGVSLEARQTKLFWRGIPGFCRDILEVPEKFETKKKLCSIFIPYNLVSLRLPTSSVKKLRSIN